MSGRSYERFGAGRIRSAAETVETRKRVRGFWHHCELPRDTLAESYLRSRGLGWAVDCEHVRFRPDCPHPSGVQLPAMVWLVLDNAGDVCAVHRTFLEAPGRKAGIDPAKATLGSFAGGAIRLHPACAEMVIAEGLETTASASVVLELPGWSAIACGNLGNNLQLPPIVRSVVIAADHDAPGQRAATAAAKRWRAEGRVVRIATPDEPGQDFNDVLRARMMEAANG